jgi:hypothetical protein
VGPYQDGMACPQVADGGGGLQIWKVAASVLNKQLQTVGKEWSSSLGDGRGLKHPTLKIQRVM